MSDRNRSLSLASGLPYMRQPVLYAGAVHTVMAFDFCNPPRVQLAPGIRHTAVGWDVQDGEWVAWNKCQLTKEDADWVREHKAQASKALTKHQDDIRRGLRKPMPPPTKPHKDTRRPSRAEANQEIKDALKGTRWGR